MSRNLVARVLRSDDILDLLHDLLERLGLVITLVLQPTRLKPVVPLLVLFGIKAVDQLLQARISNRRQHLLAILVHPPTSFAVLVLFNHL